MGARQLEATARNLSNVWSSCLRRLVEKFDGFTLLPTTVNIIRLSAVGRGRENYWKGAILDSVEAAVNWAANMSWKGIAPIVRLVETTYETGIKVLPDELKQYQPFWQRSETLPKWDITIVPT